MKKMRPFLYSFILALALCTAGDAVAAPEAKALAQKKFFSLDAKRKVQAPARFLTMKPRQKVFPIARMGGAAALPPAAGEIVSEAGLAAQSPQQKSAMTEQQAQQILSIFAAAD